MRKELFDKKPVLSLSFQFALSVIEYCEDLANHKKYIISNHLLRSGTSIWANAEGYQNCEHLPDNLDEVNKVIGTIINTSRKNSLNNKRS